MAAQHVVRFGISLPNRAVLFGLPPEVLLATAERADTSDSIDSGMGWGQLSLQAPAGSDRDIVCHCCAYQATKVGHRVHG